MLCIYLSIYYFCAVVHQSIFCRVVIYNFGVFLLVNMSIKISPSWLSKDELTYEHRVRGLVISTVGEMRSTLSAALSNEKLDPTIINNYPAYPYTVEEDEEYIQSKLSEIR